jgi:hypothetical protein
MAGATGGGADDLRQPAATIAINKRKTIERERMLFQVVVIKRDRIIASRTSGNVSSHNLPPVNKGSLVTSARANGGF